MNKFPANDTGFIPVFVFLAVKLALANNGMFFPRGAWSSGSQAEDGQKEVFLHAETGLLFCHSSWRGDLFINV